MLLIYCLLLLYWITNRQDMNPHKSFRICKYYKLLQCLPTCHRSQDYSCECWISLRKRSEKVWNIMKHSEEKCLVWGGCCGWCVRWGGWWLVGNISNTCAYYRYLHMNTQIKSNFCILTFSVAKATIKYLLVCQFKQDLKIF